MKINIYYGGRGLIEDPTIYILDKMMEVLVELRVDVNRFNLYEEKNGINMMPNTLKEADGVILATTVEWFGIGGYMQQFLDACWLYGDKQKISGIYMLPVVTASTYGEKEAEAALIKSWDLLGGIPIYGLCSYVEDHSEFETNSDYAVMIENKAEDLYRAVNQKIKILPSSNNAIKKNILRTNCIELTPQESEQLSVYVSDDTYVKKQKQDIEELTQIFKQMLGGNSQEEKDYLTYLKNCFKPQEELLTSYEITVSDLDKTIVIDIEGAVLNCFYGKKEEAAVIAKMKSDTFDDLVAGRITFQSAFMSGELTAKGDFNALRIFDSIFPFAS